MTRLATAIQIGKISSEMSSFPTANALSTPDTPPSTYVANVSDLGSRQVFGVISAMPSMSAKIVEAVATTGVEDTAQATTPSPATAMIARSERDTPPTPRQIESVKTRPVIEHLHDHHHDAPRRSIGELGREGDERQHRPDQPRAAMRVRRPAEHVTDVRHDRGNAGEAGQDPEDGDRGHQASLTGLGRLAVACEMFEGFAEERIDVGEAVLRVRHGGSGSPVLLLHGHPRTHTTWHRVAPLLAREHTVVCPDLRGYGESSKPPTTPDHEPYSKRAMARDCVALMRALGHERFAVAGHDRGAYVALRTALDHPDAVRALAVLDSIPIVEHLERCDARFARRGGTGSSSARRTSPPSASSRPTPTPGTSRIARRWARGTTPTTTGRSTIPRPSTRCSRTTAQGSGSTATTRRTTVAPVGGSPARRSCSGRRATTWRTLHGDPLAIWRSWADDLRGGSIDCGHHMAEEAPDELAARLGEFLSIPAASSASTILGNR